MKPLKVKKKPDIIYAMQYVMSDIVDIAHFCGKDIIMESRNDAATIKTPLGFLKVYPGDYIIQERNGVIYPVEQHIFEETYDIIGDEEKAGPDSEDMITIVRRIDTNLLKIMKDKS